MRAFSLLLCALIIAQPLLSKAVTGPPETTRQFIESDGDRNLLINPGFEYGKHNWNLATDASVFHLLNNSTVVGQGLRSAAFISGGENEYLESDEFVVPRGLWNRNCIASIDYNWSTGTEGDLLLRVLNHNDTSIVASDIAPVSDFTQKILPFACPQEGSIKLRIDRKDDSSGIIPAIHLDSMYLGRNASTRLDNSVTTSPSAGATVDVAFINCDSSSTINKQSGSWVSSVSNISSGACTVTWTTNYFPNDPYCLSTNFDNTTDITTLANANTTSVTTNGFGIGGSDDTSYDVMLICVGPK